MRALSTILLFLQVFAILGQTPTHIPTDNEPVSFFDTPGNIVLFIVIPVAIVILYYLWRKRLRRETKEEEKEE